MSAKDDLLERVIDYVARHGIGDTSLRTLAEEIGTSHRMLNYHFGSRDGLLAAVVEATWGHRQQQFATLLTGVGDPYAVAADFWRKLADEAPRFGPLFFELAAAAMQGHAWAAAVQDWVDAWVQTCDDLFRRGGHDSARAAVLARMTVAMARGILFELSLTGDRATADDTFHAYLESTKPRSHPSPG